MRNLWHSAIGGTDVAGQRGGGDIEEGGEPQVIEIDDVSRAFFEAPATRDICVELPRRRRRSTRMSSPIA